MQSVVLWFFDVVLSFFLYNQFYPFFYIVSNRLFPLHLVIVLACGLTTLACVGKDQVTRAVQYNAHARKLRLQAAHPHSHWTHSCVTAVQAKSLMSDALEHLKTSEVDDKR
jgi:hypothetical protein